MCARCNWSASSAPKNFREKTCQSSKSFPAEIVVTPSLGLLFPGNAPKMTLNNLFPLTTAQCARLLELKDPRTLRARVRETGSYFGVVPQVLWNGRWRWPADICEQLLNLQSDPSALLPVLADPAADHDAGHVVTSSYVEVSR
jgi:hypothetical protein